MAAIGRADDQPAKPLAKLELKDGDSIVFLGDSITHQRLYTQYVEDYFYTRMPHLRLTLHNAGVGGARAWDALQRFEKDVAAYKPKYVTILLGMNDGTYRPYDEPTFQTYRQDMSELLTQLDGIGAVAIPMTPTMFDSRAARARNMKRDDDAITLYNSVLAYYGTWLREVAQDKGYGFVDMWSPLNNLTLEQRKTDPAFTMIEDAVHPGPNGQLVMATAIINDLGLPRQVSNIQISLREGADPTVKASGGEVSNVEASEDGVAFTWKAQSLPWVVPEEAQTGVKLTRMGHRLSREALEVHGLPPGRYALTIDGVEVGRYDAAALERHIELQENAKTPQHQQALEVAMLNKERNDGPIGKLRGEWGRFQGYARTRRTTEEQPDNAQAREQLAALEQQIAGMDERVAQANKEAKEIEDRIFEINQPKERRYVLKRVANPAARRGNK
jgi:lysophospholipase L1-like esterase